MNVNDLDLFRETYKLTENSDVSNDSDIRILMHLRSELFCSDGSLWGK